MTAHNVRAIFFVAECDCHQTFLGDTEEAALESLLAHRLLEESKAVHPTAARPRHFRSAMPYGGQDE